MKPNLLLCATSACLSFLSFFMPAPLCAQGSSNPADDPVTTQHSISIHGQSLAYTARAGYLTLRDPQMRARGRMFYVSYTADKPAGTKPRPLIFAWNGGPGSNAGLLELGALGPRRLAAKAEGASALTDNEDTWLQFADLVFVDPIYAGYSYAITPEDQKQFLSDRGDAESFAEFIRLYRTHYEREAAPVYLTGESYGTYRALGVADVLAKRDISVAGLVLLSNVFSFSHPDDFDSLFLLPNYTAAAFAHNKLEAPLQRDLQKTLNEAENWAEQVYLPALTKGDRISSADKKSVATQLARYTGVPADQWEQHNLRLGADEFSVDVLDSTKGDFVGHYDTRAVGHGQPGEPYNVTNDPSLNYGVSAAILPYLRNELGWKSDALYAGPFGGRWPTPDAMRGDWTSVLWEKSGGQQDRGPLLSSLLARRSHMRMLLINGCYDLATPFAAVEYDLSHLNLSAEARSRLQLIRYEGGHAAYTDATVRHKFYLDAKSLVEVTSEQPPMKAQF
jgi:carboxypeptidase C (cathepsin A)